MMQILTQGSLIPSKNIELSGIISSGFSKNLYKFALVQ